MKTAHTISLVQLVLCVLTIWAVACEWSYWWIPGIPWIILDVVGIIIAVPVLYVIRVVGIGAALPDFRGDALIVAGMTVCFVLPTILAVGVNYCFAFSERARQEELQQLHAGRKDVPSRSGCRAEIED